MESGDQRSRLQSVRTAEHPAAGRQAAEQRPSPTGTGLDQVAAELVGESGRVFPWQGQEQERRQHIFDVEAARGRGPQQRGDPPFGVFGRVVFGLDENEADLFVAQAPARVAGRFAQKGPEILAEELPQQILEASEAVDHAHNSCSAFISKVGINPLILPESGRFVKRQGWRKVPVALAGDGG